MHSSSLPEILVKEKGYAKTVADLINRMDTEVEALNSEQQEEMDKKINQLDISTTSEVLLTPNFSISHLIDAFLNRILTSSLPISTPHIIS